MGSCLRLIFTFGVMIVLLRFRLAVGYAILAGCAALAVSGLTPIGEVLRAMRTALLDPKMINLLGIVVLITFLGEVLRHVENLAKLVRSVVGLLRNRKAAMAALPAIIGLLPMPGGAMLSAPLVREVGESLDADAERKTIINHWFRHIWEYTCPLYPAVVLMASMMGVSVIWIIIYNIPLSIAVTASGALICFRGMKKDGAPIERRGGIVKLVGALLEAVWPVGFVVVCTALPMILEARNVSVPYWASRECGINFPMLGSILIVVAVHYAVHRINWQTTRPMLRKALKPELIALVYGAMLLLALVKGANPGEPGLAANVKLFLEWARVPDLAVIFIIPFAIGVLTGMTMASTAVGFAVLMPYMYLKPNEVDHIRVMFAFASGFMGVMISPVHLCLVLTTDYFGAELGKVYRKLIPLSLIVLAVALIIALTVELRRPSTPDNAPAAVRETHSTITG